MKAIRLIINWLLVITMPLWGGAVLFVLSIKDIVDDEPGTRRRLLKGEKWAWE